MTEPKIDQNNSKHQDPNLKEGTDVELDSSTANTSDSDKDGVQTEKEDLKQPDPSEPDPEDDKLPTYEELQTEVLELKDQLLRSIAESENVRRRTEREKADSSRYAITNFARSILSVADNLNRALESVSEEACEGSEELKNLYIGIEMTGKEIDNVYEQFGIKAIEALGKKFDHNFHQAMFEVEDLEQPAGVVVQQVQKGYVIHERLLRPAMVAVSKGGPNIEETIGDEKNTTEVQSHDKAAKETSSAYAKQADATNQVADDTCPQIDKEL